jgi:general stress protein CsbA
MLWMFRMPDSHHDLFGVSKLPRKYWAALLLAVALLFAWIFSGYMSPQILILLCAIAPEGKS